MTYTPGPWFASRLSDNDEGFKSCTIGPFDTSDREHDAHYEDTICEVWELEHDGAANARLIAAAPELLDALKATLAVYVLLAESGDCGNWDPGAEEHVRVARQLIAKVENERP